MRLAISRMDQPEAIPREMSSRSARVSARRDRRRAMGAIPPRGNNKERMQLCSLPKARPISCSDCPAFHRLQTSHFSVAESPNRLPGLMSHHLRRADLHQWCCIDLSNAPRLSGLSAHSTTLNAAPAEQSDALVYISLPL